MRFATHLNALYTSTPRQPQTRRKYKKNRKKKHPLWMWMEPWEVRYHFKRQGENKLVARMYANDSVLSAGDTYSGIWLYCWVGLYNICIKSVSIMGLKLYMSTLIAGVTSLCLALSNLNSLCRHAAWGEQNRSEKFVKFTWIYCSENGSLNECFPPTPLHCIRPLSLFLISGQREPLSRGGVWFLPFLFFIPTCALSPLVCWVASGQLLI